MVSGKKEVCLDASTAVCIAFTHDRGCPSRRSSPPRRPRRHSSRGSGPWFPPLSSWAPYALGRGRRARMHGRILHTETVPLRRSSSVKLRGKIVLNMFF